MSVCVSVCPRGYLRNHTRDLYQFFVHAAYVHGSVLFRYVDERPHRPSAGRGSRSAQRRRSVIYDCLVVKALSHKSLISHSQNDLNPNPNPNSIRMTNAHSRRSAKIGIISPHHNTANLD